MSKIVNIKTDEIETNLYIVDNEDIIEDDENCIHFIYNSIDSRLIVYYNNVMYIRINKYMEKCGNVIYIAVTQQKFFQLYSNILL